MLSVKLSGRADIFEVRHRRSEYLKENEICEMKRSIDQEKERDLERGYLIEIYSVVGSK